MVQWTEPPPTHFPLGLPTETFWQDCGTEQDPEMGMSGLSLEPGRGKKICVIGCWPKTLKLWVETRLWRASLGLPLRYCACEWKWPGSRDWLANKHPTLPVGPLSFSLHKECSHILDPGSPSVRPGYNPALVSRGCQAYRERQHPESISEKISWTLPIQLLLACSPRGSLS